MKFLLPITYHLLSKICALLPTIPQSNIVQGAILNSSADILAHGSVGAFGIPADRCNAALRTHLCHVAVLPAAVALVMVRLSKKGEIEKH